MSKGKFWLIGVLVFCCNCSNVYGQGSFFSAADAEKTKLSNTERKIIPGKYFTSSLNVASLKNFLMSLPGEKGLNRKQAPILSLPMQDGKMANFRVWEYEMMEPGLAARFPEIKTFIGYGVDDPFATIRFDYNPYFGFSAQVLSTHGDVYIDPYAKGDTEHYISYLTKDNHRQSSFNCNTVLDSADAHNRPERIQGGICRGSQLFTYRLAIACSGEYATTVCSPTAPSVPSTMAAITTTLNRVNGIYEKELSIRFLLVANNSQVVYLNPATDPFTNGNELAMMNECQTTLNSVVGTTNYDAGMVLGTGNSSAASLYAICNSPSKGKAVSGLPNPTGDIFDVGRVAHNLGHLFGAADTHNSSDGNCTGDANTGYEPGSGTTIMAAAPGCGTDNLQPLPDPYFHSTSFDLITNFITGTGAGCHGIINTGNTPPRFTNNVILGANIPMNTPFQIRGVLATDDDGDPVTFIWEEVDRGPSGTWNSALTTSAPAFRSRVPQTTNERVFPDMQLILAGFPPNPPATQGGLKGETLSNISRGYTFSVTLRDGRGGVLNAGSNCSTTTFGNYAVFAVPETGPFKVNLPNGGENWSSGSQQTILWDVAGTTGPLINTQFVNIFLSDDGGLTYPYLLASNVPNDGFEMVTMPAITTTTARIKIEGALNIFFDISNSNFSITPSPVGFEFNTPAMQTVACPGPATVEFSLVTISNGGYNTPIALSASGVPAGATISFGTNPVTPGNSSTFTLSNVNTVANGNYVITITGLSGSMTRSRVLVLQVQNGAAPIITTQPVSQTDCEGNNVTFTVAGSSAISYQWQISTDGGFNFSDITSGGNSSALIVTNIGAQHNNYKYRCIVKGQCNSTISNIAGITVLGAPIISAQPQNATACAGGNASFSIAVGGLPVNYQWQVNNGSGFTNIAGALYNTLQLINVTLAMSNFQYRCLVFGQGCVTPVISSSATLIVNQLPSISISAAPYTKLLPVLQTTITANGSAASGSLPFSLRWTLDGVTLGGITGNTYTAGITRLGNYRVDITDAKGCTNQSNVLPITDSVSTKLFIFPNPAKTTVELAYYNPGGLAVNWQLIVYNANGSKVLFDRITNTGTYPKIIEKVGRLTGGVYFAILSDSSEKVLATGKLLIQQ